MTSNSPLLAHGEPAAYFTFASLTALGVPHATTTRHCPGISSFEERIVPEAPKPPFRAEAVVALGGTGLEMERVSYARQVHGADVARGPRDARSLVGQRGLARGSRGGARLDRESAALHRVSSRSPVLVPAG